MNERIRYGIARKVRTVCIVLFASHIMSVAVLCQKQPQDVVTLPDGMAAITLSDGREVQDAPVPDLPYNPDQQCPPWTRVNQLGQYTPCNVVAQAGVPFRGWIANQNLCGGDRIDAILAQTPFKTAGPANDPAYPTPPATEDFDIYYFPNGSWAERLHLGGTHVWQDPGQWSISGSAWTHCAKANGAHWDYYFPINVQVTVSQPTAPESITALGRKASPQQTYHPFGTVTLFDPAPASGSLVKLTVEKLGIVDLVTQFGRTGLQGAGTGIFYVSTYIYVPPGQKSADFDLVVAAGAHPGDDVEIFAKCVGIPGNWRIDNHCKVVNKNPQVLKVTVTP
jgi:hypothetical protein